LASEISEDIDVSAPRTYREAVDQGWTEPIQREMDCLLKNGTWTLCDPPASNQVVKCKWLFQVKSNGTMKSRLVACGYSQRARIDYFETYAPTLSKTTASFPFRSCATRVVFTSLGRRDRFPELSAY
jgi:hypothetical protein